MQIDYFDVQCVYETIAIDVNLNHVKHVIGNFDNHKTNSRKLLVFVHTIVLPFSTNIVCSCMPSSQSLM